MKYEKLKTGETYYDVRGYRMGNTTMRSMGTWSVRIIELHPDKRSATVSWNGNPPVVWCERQLNKLRVKRPETVATVFGGRRLKRRGEAGA